MSEISRAISNLAFNTYEKRLHEEVKAGQIPKHIAIIMDGNRRFASEIGLESREGHLKGKDKLEELMDWCRELDIRILTVYAFSTENLSRSPEEVKELMDLFEQNFYKAGDDPRGHKHGIRVRVIGKTELMPERVQKAIKYAEEKTKEYSNYQYNIAVAYGSRQEMVDAIKKLAQDIKDDVLEVEDIDEETFSKYLYTADLPDPDLILRTSGEERVSNFLLWQLAYAELYFTDVYWPGFRRVDFLRAIRSYQNRKRRYGT